MQRFAVSSLRLVPRASLAGATDLFAPSGPRRLTMVTCAGPYDAARGGYQNLAVVTARPVTQPASRDAGDDDTAGPELAPGASPPDAGEDPLAATVGTA